MYKILLALSLVCLFHADAAAQSKPKPKAISSASKDKDGIDGRMKGPNGEVVYIGEKGGRYYINGSGKKVYLPYEGNKNKALKKAVKKAFS
jgi:hypothetical protein